MSILVFLIVISPYTTIIPIIYMLYMVLFKKVSIHKNHWNIGLCLLFIWSLIVGVINYSFSSIVVSFALFMYLCVSIFLQDYCKNESIVEKIYMHLVSFSLISVIFGIIEKVIYVYFNINIWSKFLQITSQPVVNDRIYSTFGNPNVAGNWFAIMIIVGLYFCSIKSKTTKLFYRAATLLFFIALYLTGSRGAFIGLLCGLFIFYLLKGSKKDMWLFITIFIITVAVTFMPSEISKNITAHGFDDSFISRVGIWKGCLKMIRIKPFTGWGLMGITEHGADFMKGYFYATLYHGHNIWITIMTTLGGIGLLIYAYLKINLFRNLKILYAQKCRVVPMLAGIQAVIIGHGLVDFTMIAPQTGLLFIASSAIISSLVKQNNSPSFYDDSNDSNHEKSSKIS
ncbi:O-antigen ligase family protein [Clostridium estertheticum]|uniref:O-antigen ligase family protein n=1 Tax=Clostridium estertheticum TaxID=238834 RepID=A0AA47EI99_9CLOT|nr:O-antigen ligase family protein [Clostridium estertheticum]MBU3155931.1 O-antigen ligase family protein [Clostridium estertheticum]MBU3200544.1 O-antigen ligase family protein [Clostridium estertheticum]WAG59163.1 O-antigen ligase family protein [Clostridium estertheticum]WAG66784.1 O-antigen ligase family protein [Clostridium estertheticum]